jgi:predicted RNA methylase
MSSTNRKGNNPRRATLDYYPTPAWTVHRLLEVLQLPGGKWFEPCAGDGAIMKAVQEVRKDVTWVANEIQPEMKEKLEKIQGVTSVTSADFLKMSTDDLPEYKVIITNPPFNLAMECIQQSLGLHADYVIFLLRLNFLASKSRAKFMHENTPDVYVLSQRPRFTSNGGCDSIDYAWFVWSPSRLPLHAPGKLIIVPGKDKAEL